MRLIREVWRFGVSLIRWAFDAWRGWVPPLALVVVLMAASQLPLAPAERVLRYAGLLFQVLGILTVVSDLRGRRAMFRQPSLGEKTAAWFRRRPRWRPEAQNIVLSAVESASVAFGAESVTVWRGTAAGAPVADRLTAVEANLATLKGEHERAIEVLQASIGRLNSAMGSERRDRDAANRALQTQLEGIGAGGINLEMMGVVWLLVGVVLATSSGEIARMIARIQ
jgi:hypothetical protein